MWSRFAVVALVAAALGLSGALPAQAHQPVILDEQDATPRSGPLLPDGTVSYAVVADVRAGQERGFRFRLAKGDRLALQYLIVDEAPANALRPGELPSVQLIDPSGRMRTLVVNERTEFFEPYSRTTYLFLSRVEERAIPGTYRVIVRGRSPERVPVTVAVGYREVAGTVID